MEDQVSCRTHVAGDCSMRLGRDIDKLTRQSSLLPHGQNISYRPNKNGAPLTLSYTYSILLCLHTPPASLLT